MGDISITLTHYGYSDIAQAVASTSSTHGYREINIESSNVCGSTLRQMYLYLEGEMLAYPNPAEKELTLEFSGTFDRASWPSKVVLLSETSMKPVKELEIAQDFDKNGFAKGKKVSMDVSDLPRGVYYIHTIKGKKVSEKLRIVLK